MPSFGENLRELRKSRGYSQDKFARLIGSNQITLSSWEVGTRTPSVETIRRIAKIFNVPLSSLIPLSDSGNGEDEDFVREVADALHRDPKVRMLFDKTRYMTPEDLDVVLGVVNAIARGRDENDG